MKPQPMNMSLIILRIKKSRIEVVGASVHPSLIYRKMTGIVTDLESTGYPLGGIVNLNYTETEFNHSAGDVILLLTDGFTEQFNEKDEISGPEKAKEIFKNTTDKSSDMILTEFVKTCDEWGGSRPQYDANLRSN